MKKWYVLIGLVVSIILGFLIESAIHDPDMGYLVDFTMDQEGNVYTLNYKSNKENYTLSKISRSGVIKYKKDLETAASGATRQYKQMEIDSRGNILLLSQDRRNSDQESNATTNGIMSERIAIYTTQGDFSKEIATMDFTSENFLPSVSYMYKFQVIGTKVSIVCRSNNTYEILETDTQSSPKPENKMTFEINPPTNQSNNEWLSDMAVLSDNRVIYSDRSGQMYLMDTNNSFTNITSYLGKDVNALTFSVDENNCIYLTDAIRGYFYKVDMATMTINSLYNNDIVIDANSNTKFGDIIDTKCLKDNQYYGVSKDYKDKTLYVFGDQSYKISNIRTSILSSRLAIALGIGAGIFALFALAVLAFFRLRERNSLNLKIVLLFVPVYLLSMIGLTAVVVTQIISINTNSIIESQEASNKIILQNIDEDLFGSIDHLHGYLSNDYNTLQSQIFDGFYEAKSAIQDASDYVITYTIENNNIYRAISNEYESVYKTDSASPNYEIMDAPYIPIEYELDSESAQQYYDALEELTNSLNETVSKQHIVKDNRGEWLGVIELIKNSNGETVGLIESRIDKNEYQDQFYVETLLTVLVPLAAVTAAIFIYFFIVLRFTFRPLKQLKICVDNIGKGKWNTKVSIKTKDELHDIGVAINTMADKINQYISNLTLLNREYLKFVPQELFKLLGKSRITEVNLYDKNTKNMNVLYVLFNFSKALSSNSMTDEQYFDTLNRSYNSLFKIVEGNNGIVENFDSLSMTVLFPDSPNDAASALMQFKEVLGRSILKDYVKITLSRGDMIIGVIGSKKRASISTISDDIINRDHLIDIMTKIKVNYLVMDSIMDSIDDKIKSNYRFIGNIKNVSDDKIIKAYEFIDKSNPYKKSLYTTTKDKFEKGVNDYISGDLDTARKEFADVLKVNEEDKVAMYYLVLCNNSNKNLGKWKGYLS